MRSPERIDPFLQNLAKLWKKYPDLRFGQLISNITATSKVDPFFLEEDQFEKLMKEFEGRVGE